MTPTEQAKAALKWLDQNPTPNMPYEIKKTIRAALCANDALEALDDVMDSITNEAAGLIGWGKVLRLYDVLPTIRDRLSAPKVIE